MNFLKLFFLAIFLRLKKLFMFPQSIAAAMKDRHVRADCASNEAERLDRIRNPSKYLGR
jgi:hypothetical protein